MSYDTHFKLLAPSGHMPHDWQSDLARQESCENRLIRIPTGFGKTLGVLSTWLWHRVSRQDERWPRRLVWCLPMRVLVEQTEHEVRSALARVGLLWDGNSDHNGKIGVHLLMGGIDAGDWHLYPEHCSVLIGTQDMLISRALNRGYGAMRARWPMEFGLLNQDCLWVMDEVQLMDVGLASSAQMQAFRRDDMTKEKELRPCRTWWMSATLQHDWLMKSPDTLEMASALEKTAIQAVNRSGHLWNGVRKQCRLEDFENERQLADFVAKLHIERERGAKGPTLVVVNRVERAVQVFQALKSNKSLRRTDLRLVHSRFRPHERTSWRETFLNRDACAPGTDRIIVSTQVVEAGVDMSAGQLITELAPWPSLVQRFGRSARWGGEAQVVVADFHPADDKKAAPYSKDELDAAREALSCLGDVAPLHLEAFEEQHPEMLARLYPYEPKHLLLRHELDELFDTTPDLSGADIDISRFIRSGEERDLHTFWAGVPKKAAPESSVKATRKALCAVPVLKARDWLCGKESGSTKAPRLKAGMRAWIWNWLDGEWRRAERRDLYPGQTVLVAADCGGYDCEIGWSPETQKSVAPVSSAPPALDVQADAAQDDESLSAYPWQTIAVHGRVTGNEAKKIAGALVPNLVHLFDLSGRWHDVGKVHPAFNNSIKDTPDRPIRRDLAKAPKSAWLPVSKLYPLGNGEHRPGFRHELASVLALFAVLQRHDPDHEALLGPWKEFLNKAGMNPRQRDVDSGVPNPLEREILSLNAEQFNLLAYLVCAHHGKVRLAWHACHADQLAADRNLRIRGVRDGDILPSVVLSTSDHAFHQIPESVLDLGPASAGLNPSTGQGWTERVLLLLDRHGPFALAYLEAILRTADQRASRLTNVRDELLNPEATS
jgi:CRISPR-associated endonuclease/helicase Cas3